MDDFPWFLVFCLLGIPVGLVTGLIWVFGGWDSKAENFRPLPGKLIVLVGSGMSVWWLYAGITEGSFVGIYCVGLAGWGFAYYMLVEGDSGQTFAEIWGDLKLALYQTRKVWIFILVVLVLLSFAAKFFWASGNA